MIKHWILFLTLWGGSLFFYGLSREWTLLILFEVITLLPLLSFLVSLPAVRSAKFSVEVPSEVTKESKVRFLTRIECSFPAPRRKMRIVGRHSMTGEEVALLPGQYLPTEHCGVLDCRIEEAHIYDYLGLFRFRLSSQKSFSVTIHPEPIEIPRFLPGENNTAVSWRPKPGGGYAENHELRLYRPGDPLRQVHWKLSAKTGKLVVREAMEPRRGKLLLTMDICGPAEALDEKFGQLLWLSSYLLERELRFEICILSGSGPAVECIATEADLGKAMVRFLGLPPVTEGSVLDRERKCTWHFHIGGGTDEEK